MNCPQNCQVASTPHRRPTNAKWGIWYYKRGQSCTTSQKCRVTHPVVCRLQKRYNFFKANNLLIAKLPRPSSHTSNTVDKLNKSKSSGLVNDFTLVLPLVYWWCCCCCLFLWQWTTASFTTVVAVEAVAARQQRQQRRWRRLTMIGGKSGWQQER